MVAVLLYTVSIETPVSGDRVVELLQKGLTNIKYLLHFIFSCGLFHQKQPDQHEVLFGCEVNITAQAKSELC